MVYYRFATADQNFNTSTSFHFISENSTHVDLMLSYFVVPFTYMLAYDRMQT